MINQEQLFVFKLHENEKFIIILEDDVQSIDHYSGCKIMFHLGNQQYQLYEEFPLNIFLLTLQTLIKKSLYNVLPLHESITQDIGFLWNQWLNEDAINLVYITDHNNDTYWVGQKYELACHEYISWIYNDEQGNIIFEITPAYPLGCIDQENELEVKNYQNWMKSYEPLVITIISEETALQWLKQAEAILEEISKNMAKRVVAG